MSKNKFGRDYRLYVVGGIIITTILLIGISGAVITGGVVSRTKGACSETDRENDIYKMGTVTFENRLGADLFPDECLPDDKHLKQYYCGRPNRLNSISYFCPKGCSAGVCK